MSFTVFDDWEPRDNYITSGCREKIWLYEKQNNQLGLFKYPKINSYGVNTFEHVSEDIASKLAEILGVNCCKTILGTYNGRVGSLSCFIPQNENEVMLTGINLLKIEYTDYNEITRRDDTKNQIYSVEMIIKSLFNNALRESFYKMILFDYFIGHTDRHDSNWALLFDGNNFNFSPLYDNGSSLCAYVNENDINSYLKDNVRFNALVKTKSKSAIGINNIQKINHYDLIKILIDNKTLNEEYIFKTYLALEDKDILVILDQYRFVLSEIRINLIFKYLKTKRDMLRNLLGGNTYEQFS